MERFKKDKRIVIDANVLMSAFNELLLRSELNEEDIMEIDEKVKESLFRRIMAKLK